MSTMVNASDLKVDTRARVYNDEAFDKVINVRQGNGDLVLVTVLRGDDPFPLDWPALEADEEVEVADNEEEE